MLQSAVLLVLAAASNVVSARWCRDLTIPVSLTSRNAVFDIEPLKTEIDVTNFYLELGKQGGNLTEKLVKGYKTVSGIYTLAATYCVPDTGPGDVLQIMTHGVGFDRSYWDPPINDYKYSYVARAVDDHGYSTLTWDRLGVGKSSHGETINEIQIFLEIAALAELTRKFVNCTLCEHSYKRVVHLGHSFGSAMTYGLVNQYPDISNGIVLTGFSQIPAYMGLFALGGNFVPVSSVPSLASQYAVGYVAAGSKSAVHTNFFGPDDFDPAVLDWLYEHGQANTPGEILTVGATGGVANIFHGPSLVITGERDVPFCGGNCYATSAIQNKAPNLIAASEEFFPNASPFNATVIPKAGHGLNLGYSADLAFDTILEFLEAHV
ncbi:hypothetical protein V2G26_009234 [Clonostachys chloroleuca]